VRTARRATIAIVIRLRPKSGSRRVVKLRPRIVRFRHAGAKTIVLRLSGHARRRVGGWRKPQVVVRTFSDARRTVGTGRFVLKVR
jgi:hypothetical protein